MTKTKAAYNYPDYHFNIFAAIILFNPRQLVDTNFRVSHSPTTGHAVSLETAYPVIGETPWAIIYPVDGETLPIFYHDLDLSHLSLLHAMIFLRLKLNFWG